MNKFLSVALTVASALPTVAHAQLPSVMVTSAAYQPLSQSIPIGYVDGDDEGKLVPLNFNFPFLGQTYTHVMVNSNGLVVLGTATTTTCAASCLSNTSLPSTSAPNFSPGPMIAGFWDDLDAGIGAVRYLSSPTSFTVEFAGVQRYATPNALVSFQIRLESSGVFSIHHGSLSGAATTWTASVGFQDATGTLGVNLVSGCTSTCGLSNFIPNQLFQMGAPLAPDLTVPSVALSGLVVQTDGNLSFTVEALLSNRGRTDANGFTWRAALSRDAIFDLSATDGGADLLVATGGPVSVAGFDGGAGLRLVTAPGSTSSPPSIGEYYVLVEADSAFQVSEADESNNVGSTLTPITLGDDVFAASIVGPAVVSPGNLESIAISMTNRSVRAANGVGFQILLSADAVPGPGDLVLASGTRSFAAAQTLSETVQVTIPSTVSAGGFFLLQLDPAGAITEANELNNVAVSPSPATVSRGDLESMLVTVLDASTGQPTTVGRFGQTLRATVRVRNAGMTTLSNFRVALLLSPDTTFSLLTDTYLCEQPVSTLAASMTLDLAFTCTLPLTGPNNAPFGSGEYYLLGLVDSLGAIGESNELNNGASAGPLTLIAPGPDLTVTGVMTSTLAGPGEAFRFQRTIRNVGDAAAGPATYRYFASPDAMITGSDTPLTMSAGTVTERTVTLVAGGADVGTDFVDVPFGLTPGAWFIGCLVDFGGAVAEADERNNMVAVQVTVASSGLSVATTQVPDAVVARPFSYQLVAAGSLTSGQWALLPGDSLPPGLSLSGSGLISGTPTVPGVTSFGVRVVDMAREASARFTLRVLAAVSGVEITTTVAPAVVADPATRYELRLAATGGTAPYTWGVVSGALPPGLACSRDGVVSGFPAASLVDSSARVVFEATDTLGTVGRRELVFRVVTPGSLVVSSGEPPVAVVGRPFTHPVSVATTDGSPVSPLSWSVTGALPDGVSLVVTTNSAELAGTPTKAGLFSFALTAQDSIGRRDTVSLDVQVQGGVLDITSPDLPPPLRPGEPVEFHFVATGAIDPQFLVTSGELPTGLNLAANGTVSGVVPDERGKTWSFVVEVRDATGARGVGAFSVSVQPVASGCSSTASLTPWAILVVALLSLRRRRGLAVAASALVLTAPITASAQYVIVGPTPATYQPLTGAMPVLPDNPINLPFQVRLFDLSFSTVVLSQYGYLTPAGGYSQASSNLGIPHTSTSSFVPQAFIAPWWDALTPALGYRMQVTGTAPRRIVTFEWNGSGANLTSSRVSFQVELHETSHRVRFRYSTAFPGTVSGSVGLQRANNQGVPALSCATTGACTSTHYLAGQVIEFQPPSDLVAGALSGPEIGYSGIELPVSVQVSNTGGRDLMVPVRFLLSADAVLDGSDVTLSNQVVPLGPGEVTLVRSMGVVPAGTPEGARYVFAQLDPGATLPEPDENNNTSGPFAVVIAPPVSDLVVTSVTSPASAMVGGTVSLSADIRNAGNLATTASSASWRLSTNPVITSGDVLLGSAQTLPALAAGLTDTLQVMATLPAGLAPGPYWLGLCLNDGGGTPIAEASLVNNCLAASAPTLLSVSPLRVSTTQLPAPTPNVPYGVRLRHEGGDGAASWSVAAGVLPPGLALSAAGDLQGTPVLEGVFAFEVQVASAGETARAAFQLLVESGRPLAIVAEPLPSAWLARDYEVDLFASGGRPPYVWAVASGSWPPGLTLSMQGLLAGRPTAAGDFTATVTVTDAAGASLSRDFVLRVEGSTSLVVSLGELPAARLDEAYNAPITVTGGRAPYTLVWEWLQSVPLGPTDVPGQRLSPPGELGLQVDATGLSGTPNRAGAFALTFLVTDANGESARVQRVLSVAAAALEITTTTLPDAVVGAPYQARIETTGLAEVRVACLRGPPDYVCRVPPASAQLPAGVLLATNGELSGIPTPNGGSEAVTHTFLVKAVDARGRQAFRAISLTVAPAKASGCASVPVGSLGVLALWVLLRRRSPGAR